MLLLVAGVLFVPFYQLFTGVGLGNNPPTLTGMIIISLLVLLLPLFLFQLRLESRIDAEGVHYKYFPFFGWRVKRWSAIETAEVRIYSPIGEFGGWGLRLGWFGKGWAMNVAGDKGIQLVLKNGKRLLIGTQRPEAAAAALLQFKKKQNA